MKNIRIKSIHIENFKGIKELDVEFGNKVEISGKNTSGKTSVLDAFLWLLFNKNSEYVEKFDVRPLESDGALKHYVDIKVSAILDVDGETKEFSKTQSEKWVKHHGNEDAEFEGNVNTFTIDGYPRSEKEFKIAISEICSEDVFKTLTNPTYFPNLKWKEQREILMRLITGESDYDFAVKAGGYESILDELKKAPSTEDIQRKYSVMLKGLKTTLSELPTRIDEVSRQKVDYDVAELELAKNDLERKIRELDNSTEINHLKGKLLDCEFELNKITSTLNDEVLKATRLKKDEIDNNALEIRRKESEKSAIEYNVSSFKMRREDCEKQLIQYGDEYNVEKSKSFDMTPWTFDENSTFCKMCGQKLPESQIDTLKKDFETRLAFEKQTFENNQKSKVEYLLKKGKEVRADMDAIDVKLADYTSQLIATMNDLNALNEMAVKLNTEYDKMPKSVDLTSNSAYSETKAKYDNLKAVIVKMEEIKNDTAESSALTLELNEVNRKISAFNNNANLDERISELINEQKETSQKIADCEKILFALENFTKAKLNAISANINSHFNGVNFRLFKTNINGTIEEDCTCCVNGVPYASVNNGHKIIAGIQIIKALSEIYDARTPIFIDNAESVNDFNLPTVDCQLVLLKVTDEDKLTLKSV